MGRVEKPEQKKLPKRAASKPTIDTGEAENAASDDIPGSRRSSDATKEQAHSSPFPSPHATKGQGHSSPAKPSALKKGVTIAPSSPRSEKSNGNGIKHGVTRK